MHRNDCPDDRSSLERALARSIAEENYNDCISIPCDASNCPPKNNIHGSTMVSISNNKYSRIDNDSTISDRKTVYFNAKVSVHRLHNIPLASDMTPREKQKIWYNQGEYDQFKTEAVECARVKAIPSNSRDRLSKESGAAAMNPASAGATTERMRYSGHEYDDRISHDGRYICRRGLGYHFSRGRRRSRAAARSAVVACQKALRDGRSNDLLDLTRELNLAAINGKLASKRLKPLEESATTLALVSTKCSRVAREEARRRGEADYVVAHPELYRHCGKVPGEGAMAPAIAKKMERRNGEVSGAGLLHDNSNSGFKRRRTAGGGAGCGGGRPVSCGSDSDGDGLSAAAAGHCPNGVLQAEV